jgi:hypothetical protein
MSLALRALCVVLLGGWALTAPALNDSLNHGLQIHSETIPGVTYVNGIAMRIVRITGQDAGKLQERILSIWKLRADRPVTSVVEGAWQIHSRIVNGRSEVLQSRSAGSESELLWSTADLRASTFSSSAPALSLPAQCRTGNAVHGQSEGARFLQVTARCTGAAGDVLLALKRAAISSGFVVAITGANQLSARRGHLELLAFEVEQNEGVPTSQALVYMEHERGDAP